MHQFKIGDAVRYHAHGQFLAALKSNYEVTRLMPCEDGQEARYRIKNVGEGFERVALHDQLEPCA